MRRKPPGVVGCITPWNFPVAIPFWHMAVALVEGNTVVWKPAEQTPWCGQIIAEMFEDAGIPDGVFNLVQGYGDAGTPSSRTTASDGPRPGAPRSATRSPPRSVASPADRRLRDGWEERRRRHGEADLDIAVHSATMSSFKTTGQRCVSSERIVVHEDVYDEFKERFVDIAEDIAVGDPRRKTRSWGRSSRRIRSRSSSATTTSPARRARTCSSTAPTSVPRRPDGHEEGHWVGPVVYEVDYDEDLRRINEEVFGPSSPLEVSDFDEALEMQNDVDYGLAGAIISEDYRQINQFRDEAEVGLAYGNLPCIGAEVHLPSAASRSPGTASPGREVIEAVTERTAWTLNNSKDIEMAQGLSADIITDE